MGILGNECLKIVEKVVNHLGRSFILQKSQNFKIDLRKPSFHDFAMEERDGSNASDICCPISEEYPVNVAQRLHSALVES